MYIKHLLNALGSSILVVLIHFTSFSETNSNAPSNVCDEIITTLSTSVISQTQSEVCFNLPSGWISYQFSITNYSGGLKGSYNGQNIRKTVVLNSANTSYCFQYATGNGLVITDIEIESSQVSTTEYCNNDVLIPGSGSYGIPGSINYGAPIPGSNGYSGTGDISCGGKMELVFSANTQDYAQRELSIFFMPKLNSGYSGFYRSFNAYIGGVGHKYHLNLSAPYYKYVFQTWESIDLEFLGEGSGDFEEDCLITLESLCEERRFYRILEKAPEERLALTG